MLRFRSRCHVKSVCVKTQDTLLNCPQHPNDVASHYVDKCEFPWSIQLMCSKCSTKWFVCKYCTTGSRIQFTKRSQLQSHNYRKHPENVRRREVANVRSNQIKSNQVDTTEGMSEQTSSTEEKDDTEKEDPEDSHNNNDGDHIEQEDGYETHQDIYMQEPPNASLMEEDDGISSVHEDVNDDDVFENPHHISGEVFFEAIKPASREYFRSSHEMGGTADLVGLAYFQQRGLGKKIPSQDVDFFHRYAILSRKIGAVNRADLGELMLLYKELLENRAKKTGEIQPHSILEFPFKENKIRSSIFRGRKAYFPNYPIPQITSTEDGHAYTLLSDCLVHFFGFGGHVDNPLMTESIYPQSHVHHSRTCQKILNQKTGDCSVDEQSPVYTIFLSDWSDDFDPNYGSMNKGSVYVKTITILRGEGKRDDPAYTFPLIIGPKGSDHDAVEKIVLNDIYNLQKNTDKNRFYSDKLHKWIRVYPSIVMSLMDQPARRSYCGLSAGNGKYGARWGYACDWSHVAKFLPMCTDCFDTMNEKVVNGEESAWKHIPCDRCTCWAQDIGSDLLCHPIPNDYPDPERREYLRPRRIDFQKIHDDVRKVHQLICNGTWTTAEGRVLLHTWGLSDKTISDILDCADNCLILQGIITNGQDDSFSQQVISDSKDNPRKYSEWQPPVAWERPGGIYQFTNAIMHLISGIVKTNIILSQKWISRKYNLKVFVETADNMMQNISRLGLVWLRLPPKFGGRLVGSLSENNINLGRIGPWLYSSLPPIQDIPIFEEPQTEQRRWLKKDNMMWLRVRGLDEKGTAAELRERVAEYLEHTNPPRPLSELQGDSIILVRIFHALYRMISIIFKKTINEDDINVCGVRVRMFLQFFSRMDSELRRVQGVASHELPEEENDYSQPNNQENDAEKDVRTPYWITSYNFLSLLNLPEEMRHLGPCHSTYEGGYKGEKIVSKIKPLIQNGLIGEWATNTMKNLWIDYSSKYMSGKFDEDHDNKHNFTRNQTGKLLKVYDAIPELQVLLGYNNPMSGCINEAGELFVAIKCGNRTDTCMLVKVFLSNNCSVQYCGMKYCCMTIDNDLSRVQEIAEETICDYCVFLPLAKDAPLEIGYSIDQYYTMISRECDERMVCNSVRSYRNA